MTRLKSTCSIKSHYAKYLSVCGIFYITKTCKGKHSTHSLIPIRSAMRQHFSQCQEITSNFLRWRVNFVLCFHSECGIAPAWCCLSRPSTPHEAAPEWGGGGVCACTEQHEMIEDGLKNVLQDWKTEINNHFTCRQLKYGYFLPVRKQPQTTAVNRRWLSSDFLYSMVEDYRRFGSACCFHHQGERSVHLKFPNSKKSFSSGSQHAESEWITLSVPYRHGNQEVAVL